MDASEKTDVLEFPIETAQEHFQMSICWKDGGTTIVPKHLHSSRCTIEPPTKEKLDTFSKNQQYPKNVEMYIYSVKLAFSFAEDARLGRTSSVVGIKYKKDQLIGMVTPPILDQADFRLETDSNKRIYTKLHFNFRNDGALHQVDCVLPVTELNEIMRQVRETPEASFGSAPEASSAPE